MGIDAVRIRISEISSSHLSKLVSILSEPNSEYLCNYFPIIKRNSYVEIQFGIVSNTMLTEADLLTPLYVFVAAHCDSAPVLSLWFSSTSNVRFLSTISGVPVWQDESDTTLAEYILATTGTGSSLVEHFEEAGAELREAFDGDVNLIEFGEGGDPTWLEKALALGVSVVSTDELEDIYSSWSLFPLTMAALEFTDEEIRSIEQVNSKERLVDWLKCYDGCYISKSNS